MAIYDLHNRIDVVQVDGITKTGLYNLDGSWNVVKVNELPDVGLYHPCGAYNVTVVDGSGFVGATAKNGSLNIFIGDGNPYGCFSVNDVLGTLPNGAPITDNILCSDSSSLLSSDGTTLVWQ